MVIHIIIIIIQSTNKNKKKGENLRTSLFLHLDHSTGYSDSSSLHNPQTLHYSLGIVNNVRFFPFFILFPLKAKMHKLHKNSGGGEISSRRVGRYVLCGFFWWMVILWIHKALKNIKKPKKLEKKLFSCDTLGKLYHFLRTHSFSVFLKLKKKKQRILSSCLCALYFLHFSPAFFILLTHTDSAKCIKPVGW